MAHNPELSLDPKAADTQKVDRIDTLSSWHINSQADAGAIYKGAPTPLSNEQNQVELSKNNFPKLEVDVVADIHRAEDHYVFDHDNGTEAGDKRAQGLHRALKEAEDFVNKNPDQAKKFVSDLQSQDLLPQLAIAALEDAVKVGEWHGQQVDNLDRTQAVNLIDGQNPLAEALKEHLSKSFSVEPGHGFGGGYADVDKRVADNNGGHTEPGLSRHHLDALMHDFSHPPDYLSTTAQAAKDKVGAESWFSKLF